MATKIIKAVFGGGRYAVTNKRTRTDYGQVLEFVGVDLPDTFECIFSNSNTSAGVGKKQIGSDQRVLIPDEYLATGQTIYAWVLVHDSEDDGRHMYNVKIPVDDMPDLSPEEPTPVEQSVISQAITALNTAVDATSQKVQEASDSADRAEQAAEGVEAYVERAEAAQSASESAQEYASASSVSASQASGYATTAESKATEASGYASSASTSAQTASQKALEASHSASTAVQAKTDAESAKTASQTAQGLAEQARNGAVTAKTDAESARDEVQEIVDGISGKVEQIDSNTERIESLEDDRYKPYPTDSASGSIASFPDGADNIPLKSCIVQVEPVQDLHGYDSPWPAGGGKNLFDADTIYADYKQGDGSFIGSGNNASRIRFNIPESLIGKELTFSGYMLIPSDSAMTNCRVAARVSGSQKSGNYVTGNTYERSSVTFTPTSVDDYVQLTYCSNGQENFQFKELQLEIGSTATDWTPYENICPISGWTGCEVQRTGKNLLSYPFDTASGTSFGGLTVTYTDNGVITVKGTKTANGTYTLKTMKLPAGTYTVYTNAELPSGMSLMVYHAASNTTYANVRTVAQTFTLTEELELLVYILIQSILTGDVDITFRPQIEVGSTATDYEPYQGNTYPITFPSEAGTVYGAHIDVLNGELVVTHQAKTFDGTENWLVITGTNRFYVNMSLNDFDVYDVGWASDKYPYGGYRNNSSNMNIDHSFYTNYNSGDKYQNRVFVFDTYFADVEAFKASLVANPLTVYGMLKEPIHYSLTPQEIKTLLGQNNLWANTGDTEVTYRADTTLYISRLTEPDADMVADSNITNGSYFMVGNDLYRATVNIASGAQVIEGTNAIRISLATALNEINA